jgi:hypothetical protein
MRKWYEYQISNIVQNHDWTLTYTPVTNIYDLFSRDFESVKKSYYQWRDTNHPAVNCAKPLVGSPEYIKYIQEKYDANKRNYF